MTVIRQEKSYHIRNIEEKTEEDKGLPVRKLPLKRSLQMKPLVMCTDANNDHK